MSTLKSKLQTSAILKLCTLTEPEHRASNEKLRLLKFAGKTIIPSQCRTLFEPKQTN